MERLTVGIFNDCFPPTIDGVANVAVNYAKIIQQKHGTAIVVTPWYPEVKDDYPFHVVRYPSAYINKKLGYRAGYPFDPFIINHLKKSNMNIIHTHCPFSSTVLARTVRRYQEMPVVFTYHTKYDIDIDNIISSDRLRNVSVRFVVNNINACDEIWVVSKGAGKNLESLGCTREYLIMDNGTDFIKGKASEKEIVRLRKLYDLGEHTPVFLYVGRMMWYKGIRLILDGLKMVKTQGYPFIMFFVGDGPHHKEIEDYAEKCGLTKECIFTGAIMDREQLRSYYSLARLFLFPSTFDTNGIVVNEAAACFCPSLLIAESCAAEKIVHDKTGILITEDCTQLACAVMFACDHPSFMKRIGEKAAEEIYLSWEDAVKKAYERYQIIVENYQSRIRTNRKFSFWSQ